MGMVLIYGCLLFFLLPLIAGIVLFIYSRKAKSKISLAISISIFLLLLFALFTNTIDEYSITKKDVVADLEHIDIRLNDDFTILNNKVSGMPERIQKTTILVSTKDKNRILNKIKNAANFASLLDEAAIINSGHYGMSDTVINFRFPDFYSRELYSRIDNYPTRIILSVDENSDTISYQRIED